MGQKNNGGMVAGIIAVAAVALCCAAPLILVGLAGLAPAILAALGSPWTVVAAAAVLGLAAAAIILWRRSRAGSYSG